MLGPRADLTIRHRQTGNAAHDYCDARCRRELVHQQFQRLRAIAAARAAQPARFPALKKNIIPAIASPVFVLRVSAQAQTNIPAGILYLLAEEHDAAVTCVEAEPLHTLFPGDL